MASTDGRTNLGGDIMIHGKCASVGCLAMTDLPIEDLFVLTVDAGQSNVKVILAPFDLLTKDAPTPLLKTLPKWVPGLYGTLKQELKNLPDRNPGKLSRSQ